MEWIRPPWAAGRISGRLVEVWPDPCFWWKVSRVSVSAFLKRGRM